MLSLIYADASSVEKDRELLKEILSRDEFTVYYRQSKNAFSELLERFFNWLGERFPDVPLDGLVTEGGITAVSWVLVAVAAVLLLLVIYWLVRQVRRQRRVKPGVWQSGGELVRDYSYYLGKAREFGSQGEWREGIRHAFLLLLFFMDRREWVRVERWKTNFEYGLELRDRNRAWYEWFRGMAVVFERAWYGKLPVSAGDFERYLGEIEAGIRKEEGGGPVE
ncbi:MAG: DUF4129 domain-containing protein [Firmicutes bacterium]|nr:DUF4129 domain-containing protein [Bacillota bacterium]